jgi:hypothetical protein
VLAVTWIVCVQGAAYQVVVECVEPSFNIYIYIYIYLISFECVVHM